MKLLYGTKNLAKLKAMQKRLQPLDIEIISLNDLKKEIPDVMEDGNTPLENARKKAWTYYKEYAIPVFSCDSGLYIKQLPDKLQPAVHVRRVNGRNLSDEEMIAYYGGLAKKYGTLTARYYNAICLILNQEKSYESMDEALASESFLITEKPHSIRKKGFPLDSLSLEIKTGEYYLDRDAAYLDKVAVEEGFLDFFKECLKSV